MNKEYIHPVTGKPISRQRYKQLKNISEGKCPFCNSPKAQIPGRKTDLCEYHIIKSDMHNMKVAMRDGHKFYPHAHKVNKPDLSGVDWSKSDVQIAKEYGTSFGVVRGYRYRNGKPIYPKGSRGASRMDLSGVNWFQPDHVIAASLGVKRDAVWRRRKALGIPLHRDMWKTLDNKPA